MIRPMLLAAALAGSAIGGASASQTVVVDGTRIAIPDEMAPRPGPLDDAARERGLQGALNRAFVTVHGHAEGLAVFRDPRHPEDSLVLGRVPSPPAEWPEGNPGVIVPVPGTAGTDRRVYLVQSRSHIVPYATVECGYGAFNVDAGRPLATGHARCVVWGRFTRSVGFELRDPDLRDDGDLKRLGLAVRDAVEALFPES